MAAPFGHCRTFMLGNFLKVPAAPPPIIFFDLFGFSESRGDQKGYKHREGGMIFKEGG